MAETSTQDVVKQALSVGDESPTDVSGTLTSTDAVAGVEGHDGSGVQTQDASDVQQITVNGDDVISDAQNAELDDTVTQQQVDRDANSTPGIAEDAQVNGIDSASHTGSDDDHQRSTDGDSQAEAKGPIEGSWRDRSNSISKQRPTSFKSVSVTKNYLAKSGSSVPTVAKALLDKGAGGLSPALANASAARPRLVAKLGRDKLSRSPAGVPSSGAPDASTVWNRNRAAPVQPTKQFTDEELKQQFGIHMASRLQADEANKDGKWADEDDDEDDWVPETVQWMDGTKSSVLAEPTAPVKPNLSQLQPKSEAAIDADKKASIAQLQPIGLASAGKTILRPGARSSSSVLTQPGLALKSVPEAPSPTIKTTSTSSSKSPWAPIPVVDKASPIVFEPPPQGYPIQSYSTMRRDSSAVDDFPSPSPAREIAADDFNRSYQEGDRGSQILFNSQSGRYEPVKGSRRTSRNDSGLRPQMVLQRPSQGQMEAFHNDRRQESSSSDPQDPAKPQSLQQSEPSAAQPSATGGSMQPEAPARSPEEVRVEQLRLMREKIEQARKRKQEEEAREEAEKKERIRLKLASLAPPAEKPQEKAAQASTTSANIQPPPGNIDQSIAQTAQPSQVQVSQLPAQPSAPEHLTTLPPPNLPVQVPSPLAETSSAPQPTKQPQSTSQPQPTTKISPSGQILHKSASDSNTTPARPSPIEPTELPGLGQLPGDQRQTPSWNRAQPVQSWNNRSPSIQASVWAPVANERPLGNGIFSGDVNRLPQQASPSRPKGAAAAWNAYSSNVEASDKILDDQRLDIANRDFQRMLVERQRQGAQLQNRHPTIQETYIPTRMVNGVRRKITEDQDQVIHQGPRDPNEAVFGSPHGGMMMQHGQMSSPLQPMPNGRSSRFFGPGVDRGQALPDVHHPGPIARPVEPQPSPPRSQSPPPPPPDNVEHPAFERSRSTQPRNVVVNLPIRPKPVVKLPPADARPLLQREPSSVTMPPGPIAALPDWQARFKGLFMGVPQPALGTASVVRPMAIAAARQAPAPLTSSKVGLDGSLESTTATISLPSRSRKATPEAPETVPSIDAILDDREFGSRPKVNPPKAPHPRQAVFEQPAPPKRNSMQVERWEKDSAFARTTDALSFKHFIEKDDMQDKKQKIHIRLFGREARFALMNSKFARSPANKHPRPNKNAGQAQKRKGSVKLQPSQEPSATSSPNATPNATPNKKGKAPVRQGGTQSRVASEAKGKPANFDLPASASASTQRPSAPQAEPSTDKHDGFAPTIRSFAKAPKAPRGGKRGGYRGMSSQRSQAV